MKYPTLLLSLLAYLATQCQPVSSSQEKQVESSSVSVLKASFTNDVSTNQTSPILSAAEREAVLNVYQNTFASVPFDNCSGDPVDFFAQIAKQGENMVLDQFPVSVDEEEQLGEMMHENIQKEYIVNDDHPQHEYISRVFNKLLPYRERKEIDFDIHLIENEMINAFAVAGGHIYVTTGLLEFVESEDELASILGHEIGHVDRKHSLRKMQKLMIASQFGDLGAIAANVNLTLTAPFGQADEYESDTRGADLSHAAGYNPRRGKDFFTKRKQKEKYNLLEKMMRTHPYSEQRERCLESYIRDNID